MAFLNPTFWKNKRTAPSKPAAFGYRQLLGTGTPLCCGTFQTTDPNASNYLPPCCITAYVDRKEAFSLTGSVYTKFAGFYLSFPARPTP